ncbi:MAG: substrate-binding domain-containing protein [Kiritimatiellia bacterium]|jgi:LacI family transcriptional regulator
MSAERILYLDMIVGERIQEMKLAGIRRYAKARGWDVVPVDRRESRPAKILKQLAKHEPIGCIIECSDGREDLPPSRFGDLPVVYLNSARNLYGGAVPRVGIDHKAVARAAFRELSASRPAAYAVVGFRGKRAWSLDRERAFRAFAVATGRSCHVFPRRDETVEEKISRLARWAARLPRSCAVFAVNDRTAAEVVAACQMAGRRIPQDLTLLGVDNEPVSEASDPPVSSIQLDFERAGHQAARQLDFMLSGHPDAPAEYMFGPLLAVRRESTCGSGRREPRILAAVEMIRREACDGLMPRDLIARFPGSRRLFELRFREAMGRSILDEIQHVRLERVETLLARTDTPIGAIASFCGYGSDIQLRKIFRARTGMSMREWRKKNQG